MLGHTTQFGGAQPLVCTGSTMWPVALTVFISSLATAEGTGASLASANSQRQQYAQAYPYNDREMKSSLSDMVNALSPFLLPPTSHTAEKVDEADQYYYPYYYNTEDNADQYYYPYYYNTEGRADQYYYPYYYNTKDNADIFYKPYSQQFDPWLAYYERQSELPQHAGLYEGPKDQLPQHTELYEGPKDQLPQHAGLYDGPINPQDNMIFDVPKLFLKHYN